MPLWSFLGSEGLLVSRHDPGGSILNRRATALLNRRASPQLAEAGGEEILDADEDRLEAKATAPCLRQLLPRVEHVDTPAFKIGHVTGSDSQPP